MFNYLVNLTPHTVHLFTSLSGDTPTAIPSNGEARVTELVTNSVDGPIGWDPFADGGMHIDVPLVSKGYGEVTGVPEPRPYTLYIVSALVQAACPQRTDLVAPHDIVRDEKGNIRGCRGFSRGIPPVLVTTEADCEITVDLDTPNGPVVEYGPDDDEESVEASLPPGWAVSWGSPAYKLSSGRYRLPLIRE